MCVSVDGLSVLSPNVLHISRRSTEDSLTPGNNRTDVTALSFSDHGGVISQQDSRTNDGDVFLPGSNQKGVIMCSSLVLSNCANTS